MGATPAWQDYEFQACDFFRVMGMHAEVKEQVQGARAAHSVDVVVRPVQLGWRHLWLVECKARRRPVEKQHVLTFLQVVVDVGADRGFLLSEAGFQPAALDAAEKTNVTLTSLAQLQAVAEEEMATSARTVPFVIDVFEDEDFGTGPNTYLTLRRRDGGALAMPMTALAYHDNVEWRYEVQEHDLSEDRAQAQVSLYSFNCTRTTQPVMPSGVGYRLVWRTPTGPVAGDFAVYPEK